MSSGGTTNNNSEAMSKLINFYKERRITIEALDKGNDLFEMVEGSDTLRNRGPMYRPKALKTGDQIRAANKHIVYYAWHFGEYIKELAVAEKGMTAEQAKKLVQNHLKQHKSIRIVAYLANEHKHSVITKSWGDDIKPRYAELCVLFPDGRGTYSGFMGTEMPLDLSGTFEGPAIQSVMLYDKDNKRLGHARQVADDAAAAWVKLLEKMGYKL